MKASTWLVTLSGCAWALAQTLSRRTPRGNAR